MDTQDTQAHSPTSLNLLTTIDGANYTTIPQLLDLPIPSSTYTHRPIPHMLLVDKVMNVAKSMGLTITQQAHALSSNKERYFGMMEIAIEIDEPQVEWPDCVTCGKTRIQHLDAYSFDGRLDGACDRFVAPLSSSSSSSRRGYSTVLGLRNSHDKSIGAGLVCGSGVYVCGNLCFYGEVGISIRHTARILDRLDGDTIPQAMLGVLDMEKVQSSRMAHYQRVPIDPNNESLIYPTLIDAMDSKVIPSSGIKNVLAEYRSPSYDEFAADTSVYRLFNAFTTVMKPNKMSGLWTMPARGAGLHKVVDNRWLN